MSRRCGRAFGALALAALLASCGGRPFEYRSQTEIPEGPGLLTGEKGAIVFGRSARTASADAAASNPRSPRPTSEDFAEFEAYREFRRSKDGRTPDYREFLEWREFQEYREWKKRRESGAR